MRTSIFCLALIFGSTLAAPPTVPNPEKLEAIPARIQRFVDTGDLAGAVCVVGRRDGIIHESAVGFSNIATKEPTKTSTLFRIDIR